MEPCHNPVGTAAAIVAAAITLWVIWNTLQATKSSADAARTLAKEAELRTRPWVYVTDAKFIPAASPQRSELPITGTIQDVLWLSYNNIGALPALNCQIHWSLEEAPQAIESLLLPAGPSHSVFPNELCYYTCALANFITIWKQRHASVVVSGRIFYQHGKKEYVRKFSVIHDFGAGELEVGFDMTRWRNDEAE